MEKEKKIGFFFGAGAEMGYGLPSGADYTNQTLWKKRSKLYDELAKYYKDINYCNDIGGYRKNFHFASDSKFFKEIVQISSEKNPTDEMCKKCLELLENLSKKENSIAFKNIFNEIIEDVDDSRNSNIQYDKLKSNFTYNGVMESKFSTISSPKELGIDKFWSLINYFWSCYVSILMPILENSLNNEKLIEYNKNKYSYIINNLKEIVKNIYEEPKKFFESYKTKGTPYYDTLKDFNPKLILTTNYTPFINIFGKDTEKIFLAGRLCDFEVPNTFELDKIGNIKNYKEKFIFPYMMTQAPIKPIIHPKQITAYAKAIEGLNKIDTLIIIGYSFGKSDDHINAILSDFVKKENKKIVFCKYLKKDSSDKETEKIHDEITNSLRLSPEFSNKIEIILHNGNAEELKNSLCEEVFKKN